MTPDDQTPSPEVESSTQSESLIDLLSQLIVASSATDVLVAFRAFMEHAYPGFYVTLWYLDEVSRPAALLLADEFGVQHGGSVRPDHNRLASGVGIAGTAWASSATQHKDMSDPTDRKLAAAPSAFIELERIKRITALPWRPEGTQPGGVILLGARKDEWLTSQDELIIQRAARQVLHSLVRMVQDRSRSILPNLVSELSELSSAEDILELALKIMAPEFGAHFGIAVSVLPHDYLVLVKWDGAGTTREVIARPRGLELRNLPQSVRLFHAMDPSELATNTIPEPLISWLRDRVTGRIGRLDHVIGAPLGDRLLHRAATGGFILLARDADSLAFLPEESRVLDRASEHLNLLVALNRREELRQRVVGATGDVAFGEDLPLAIVSFFLSSEDIVSYKIATLIIERDTDTWEAYSYIPTKRGSDLRVGVSSLTPEQLPASDPAVRAIDGIALELLDHPRGEIEVTLGKLADDLVPPPAHRAETGDSHVALKLPLLFGNRVRGAVFISLHDSRELLQEQIHYIRTLAQQLAVTWNVQRLRGTEERFLQLVDRFDRLVSGSLLSLSLSHETKGKLGAFANHFNTIGEVANQIAGLGDSSLSPRAATLSSIAKAGTENIRMLDDLAKAISDALLSEADGSTRSPSIAASPTTYIYINDVVKLYHKALKEVGRDDAGRIEKTIDISKLAQALDKPKDGTGHPLSDDPFDRIRLGQVVSNLVLNALDASPPRGRIEIETHYERGGSARLVVRDFGIGMTDDVKVRIFEPFFSRKQGSRKGFGLGMLIVRSLVRDMGGDLTFVTKPHAGTTFTVELPLPVRRRIGDRRNLIGQSSRDPRE